MSPRRLMLLALGLLVGVLGFVVLPLSTIAYDLPINYAAAWDLRHGGHLYDPQRLEEVARQLGLPRGPLPYTTLYASYLQPPLSAILTIPFTLLPYDAAKAAFLATNLGLLAIAMRLATRAASWRAMVQTPAFGLVAIALALGFRELVMTLHLGQINIWVLACLAGSLWAVDRRLWWLVGLLLATATGLKLLPGVGILWLLARGHMRAAVWTVGLLAAFFVVTLPVLGFDTYVRYYYEVLLPTSQGSAHFLNASLLADVMRMGLPREVWTSPEVAPSGEWFVVVRALLVVVGVAAILWVLWVVRWRGEVEQPERFTPTLTLPHRGGGDETRVGRDSSAGDPWLELGLVLTLALLFSPIAWEHYIVWLLFVVPPAVRAVTGRLMAREGWLLFGVVWVLLNVPTEAIVGSGAPVVFTWVRTVGLVVGAGVLVVAATRRSVRAEGGA